jgi:tetratricopeptide (TPR) repeat protein
MNVEIDNARVAWSWAVEREKVEQLDRAAEGICSFYLERMRCEEGNAVCQAAIESVSAMASLPTSTSRKSPRALTHNQAQKCEPGGTVSRRELLSEQQLALRVWARLLVWQGHFKREAGDVESYERLLSQSLSLVETAEQDGQDVRAEKAFALLWMGDRLLHSGRREGRQLYERSLALYRQLGDRWGTARVLRGMGWTAWYHGDYDKAERSLWESQAIFRSIRDYAQAETAYYWLSQLAYHRGEAEEAVRLARRSIGQGVLYPGTQNAVLGEVLPLSGNYAEAHTCLEEALAACAEQSTHRRLVLYAIPYLAAVKAGLGLYEDARDLAQRGLEGARELRNRRRVGFNLCVLGSVALAEGAFAEAEGRLQASVAVYREIGMLAELGWALACKGYAARGLGQPERAWPFLAEALQIGAEIGAFFPPITALPAVALLLIEENQVERAVELYACVMRYPYATNSRWFEDVAGREISAAEETLQPKVVAGAQERGQARDLWATAEELLDELISGGESSRLANQPEGRG